MNNNNKTTKLRILLCCSIAVAIGGYFMNSLLAGSSYEKTIMSSVIGGEGKCYECIDEVIECSGGVSGSDCANVEGIPFACGSSNCGGGDAGAPEKKSDAYCKKNDDPNSNCETDTWDLLANGCIKMCRPNISSICACRKEDGGTTAYTIKNVKVCTSL